jgi:hypothetical protein
MYDWEIQNYIKERNYVLSSEEYIYICNNSPQLNQIKYNAFEDCFEAWSDCNYFKFQVYPETH